MMIASIQILVTKIAEGELRRTETYADGKQIVSTSKGTGGDHIVIVRLLYIYYYVLLELDSSSRHWGVWELRL